MTKVIMKKKGESKEVVMNEETSISKAEFKALIEKYKLQNPVKYEQKKVALEKQLNAMK